MLAGPRPAVRKILQVTGLESVFTVARRPGGGCRPVTGTAGPLAAAAPGIPRVSHEDAPCLQAVTWPSSSRPGKSPTGSAGPCARPSGCPAWIWSWSLTTDRTTTTRVLAERRCGRGQCTPGRAARAPRWRRAPRRCACWTTRKAARVPRHLLFLDADLGDTAQHAGPLAEPVRRGEADMTIAVFSSTVKLGGHGFVVKLSGAGIERATGWRPAQPLNGQRCLTRAAFDAARPIAGGSAPRPRSPSTCSAGECGSPRSRCRWRTGPPGRTGVLSCTAPGSSPTWAGPWPTAMTWRRGVPQDSGPPRTGRPDQTSRRARGRRRSPISGAVPVGGPPGAGGCGRDPAQAGWRDGGEHRAHADRRHARTLRHGAGAARAAGPAAVGIRRPSVGLPGGRRSPSPRSSPAASGSP